MPSSGSPQKSVGVTIFGLIIIVGSGVQLFQYILGGYSFETYKLIHQPYMSEYVVVLRFVVSVSLRLVSLIAGILIVDRSKFGRKTILAVSWFTIVTIYWKHPYQGVVIFTERLYKIPYYTNLIESVNLDHSTIMSAATSCLWGVDILYAAVMIFFFTRPKVKAQFNGG